MAASAHAPARVLLRTMTPVAGRECRIGAPNRISGLATFLRATRV